MSKPPPGWDPPKGYHKAGILIRDDFHEKIKTIAARSNKKPWQVIDSILERGLDGVDIPPVVNLQDLFKSHTAKTKPKKP